MLHMTQYEFLDNGGNPMAIAHRGGAQEAAIEGYAENSLLAFSMVRNLGYRYVETDVRATREGDVYTFHGQGGERVNKHQALNKADARALGAPLLAEVLDAFPDMRFMIDPKHWPVVEPLAEVIRSTRSGNRISVGSFSQHRTDRAAQAIYEATGCAVPTAMGPRHLLGRLMLHTTAPHRSWRAPDPLVQIPRSATRRRLIDTAHAGGASVISWVVNEPTEMVHFLDDGVDGIMTDRPSALKLVLQSRGQWQNY